MPFYETRDAKLRTGRENKTHFQNVDDGINNAGRNEWTSDVRGVGPRSLRTDGGRDGRLSVSVKAAKN